MKTEDLPRYSEGKVISKDGTTIGYRQKGRGPGVVILHGGGRASQHYLLLADELANWFTVYIPDRRGRGLSGPVGEDYSIHKETDDLDALLQATGACRVFGHSAGGFIALETAIELPVEKLAVYEPPVSIRGSIDFSFLPRMEKALSDQDGAAAFVIFLKGLRLNWMTRLPFWLLYPMARQMLRDADGQEMVRLLPTAIWEAREVERLDSTEARYAAIRADTLLMSGSRSPAYLRDSLPILERIIPHARWIEYPGYDHQAPDQKAPKVIAARLKEFYSN
ncbi:MAG TPA: alpha/beta hydrolase [Anaerolineales bacterium]|nr:alpha/beta hydrolase [Anaerolineales bacterium]